jgi:hypothetical protein
MERRDAIIFRERGTHGRKRSRKRSKERPRSADRSQWPREERDGAARHGIGRGGRSPLPRQVRARIVANPGSDRVSLGLVRAATVARRTRPPRDARLDRLDVLAPNGPVVLVIAGMTLVGISQGSPSGSTTSVNVFQAQEAIGRAMEPAISA